MVRGILVSQPSQNATIVKGIPVVEETVKPVSRGILVSPPASYYTESRSDNYEESDAGDTIAAVGLGIGIAALFACAFAPWGHSYHHYRPNHHYRGHFRFHPRAHYAPHHSYTPHPYRPCR